MGRSALRSRAVLAAGALALVAGLITPVPAAANHGSSTLEVLAEMERNGIGGTTRLVATISPAASNAPGAGAVLVKFKIVSGPNSKNADLTAPDFQCRVPPGESICSPLASYKDTQASGQFAQTDVIVAWIDHDADNATTEADTAEQQDAGGAPQEPSCINDCRSDYGTPGDVGEPDVTDVVYREWGQLKTSYIPYHDGLQPGEQFCANGNVRSDGEIAASLSRCSFAFALSPENETSDVDFGAVWAQSGLDARRGWCAKRVTTSIAVPEGATLLGIAAPPSRVSRRRVLVNALSVGDAELTEGVPTLRQLFFAYPRSIRIAEGTDGRTMRLVWEGSSDAPLAFAFGLHVSWDPAVGVPSMPTPASVKARVVRDRTC